MSRANRIGRLLYLGVTISFLIPIVFLVLRMIFGASTESEAGYHSDADYVLMLMQCVLGLITIHLPGLLERKLRFELPGLLYGFYIVFLYCAIFLGEVRSFYYLVPRWDVILHFFSSMMTGFFGLMVVVILNRNKHISMNLSPFFLCLFAFCFSVTIGALWEVFEYTADGLLGVNMQKFITADGVVLSGHAALTDTMKDIIVDMLGAILASLIGLFSIRRDLKWFIPVLTDETEPEENAEQEESN